MTEFSVPKRPAVAMPPASSARRDESDTDLKSKAADISQRLVVTLVLVVAAVCATDSSAQIVDDVEELAWDRPEAWAMKFFNSVSLLTGLGPPTVREPWSLEIGLELDSIPHLSVDQRRVGFGGAKVEDLNKVPVFVRPRVAIGLPSDWSLDIAYVPPFEFQGVKSHLFGMAAERPLYSEGPWTLGARFFGQIGKAESDFTCSSDEASFQSGSPKNIWGCEAASNDEVTLNYVGAAFTGGFRYRRTEFHWNLAGNFMDMEFQVNAVTFGFVDRSLLLAEGWTWSFAAGATWALGDRASFAAEVFYSPLSVARLPSSTSENDALTNLRTIFRIGL